MAVLLVRPEAPWAIRLLPPFPSIAQRIMSLASQDEVNIHELGDIVKMDPSFSAELLRLANSAIFAVRREVKTLSQAVFMVGTERIKSMATMVVLNRLVRASIHCTALRKVWLHSLMTAKIAEEAAPLMHVERETAYTAGLLHNLGVLGMMSAYPDEYSRMLQVSDDFGFDVLKTEQDLFEIDHCAAGAYLARDWDYPDELAAAIGSHHELPVMGEAGLANLIRISWRLCDVLGYAAFSPERKWSWEDIVAFLPHAECSWVGESQENAQAELAKKAALALV